MKLILGSRYVALIGARADLRKGLAQVQLDLSEIRKEAIESAGWKKCCRCFPRSVGDDGFCGCCLYNHDTGMQIEFEPDPDHELDS